MASHHRLLSAFLFLIAMSNCLGQEFTVTTILDDPYTMVVVSEGGERELKGFIPDLMDLLSKQLGFTYRFKLVADGKFGSINQDGNWNGMIGEVIRGEADIAAAALTITDLREEVADFTKPYINVGITGIRQRPRNENTMNNLEELAESEDFQFGIIYGGSTMTFFRESTDPVIQRLWKKFTESPVSWGCSSASHCIERVHSSENYIYFGESTTIDYITRRDCRLTQFGGLLEGSIRGYGLALREGDAYVDQLNEGILRLIEDGSLHLLYLKWWQGYRRSCDPEN